MMCSSIVLELIDRPTVSRFRVLVRDYSPAGHGFLDDVPAVSPSLGVEVSSVLAIDMVETASTIASDQMVDHAAVMESMRDVPTRVGLLAISIPCIVYAPHESRVAGWWSWYKWWGAGSTGCRTVTCLPSGACEASSGRE